MKTLRLYSLAICCMALILMTCGAFRAAAQEVTATVTGTVTDSSGAAVAGATVAVKSVERGVVYDTTTNDSGLYHISQLPVGRYEVRVEKPGFSSVE
jgi:Cna protein B-type domain.